MPAETRETGMDPFVFLCLGMCSRHFGTSKRAGIWPIDSFQRPACLTGRADRRKHVNPVHAPWTSGGRSLSTKPPELFKVIIANACICGTPPAVLRCSSGRASIPPLLTFQPIAVGHRFQFHTNGVGDGDDGASFEREGGQHRTELMYFERVVTFHQHIPAPITDADNEGLDFEIGQRGLLA